MQTKDPVFPSNLQEISSRLCTDPCPEYLSIWTCDNAAQVISGISPYVLNGYDVDNFEMMSRVLNTCMISGEIDSFEIKGERFFKALAVLEWVIVNAEFEDHQLPLVVYKIYEEKKRVQAISPSKTEGTMQVHERELTSWLRQAWEDENRPNGSGFFLKLKKYKGEPGSPILDHYSAGKVAGISWVTSSGTTGEMRKKTIQNKVSEFKKQAITLSIAKNRQNSL